MDAGQWPTGCALLCIQTPISNPDHFTYVLAHQAPDKWTFWPEFVL